MDCDKCDRVLKGPVEVCGDPVGVTTEQLTPILMGWGGSPREELLQSNEETSAGGFGRKTELSRPEQAAWASQRDAEWWGDL